MSGTGNRLALDASQNASNADFFNSIRALGTLDERTKRGIKAEGRRDSKGRTHGTAIGLPSVHSFDLSRIGPA